MFESLSAEIIAIGSELLAPDRTDTNSLWLTEQLNRLGIEVKLKTIVGDDDARLEETIRDAVRRSKVVITTGGLGPTEDDITRKITARALGRRLLLDEVVLAEIRQRFQSFGVTMPERNSRQAMVIEDAEVLPNPNGTAPGMFLDHQGTAIVLLPGPPRELKPMFENHVASKLAGRAGSLRVVRRMMRVAGMGESAVDEKIAPVYSQYDNPVTTILFNKSEIEIHLTARGRTEAEANELLDRLSGQIEERLGNAIFSFAGETGQAYTIGFQERNEIRSYAYKNLGNAYNGLKKYDEAANALKKSSEIEPTNVSAHFNLGLTLYNAGRYSEAIDSYKQVIKLRPNLPQAYFNLALTYYAINDKTQAMAQYETLKGINPEMAKQLYDQIKH